MNQVNTVHCWIHYYNTEMYRPAMDYLIRILERRLIQSCLRYVGDRCLNFSVRNSFIFMMVFVGREL